MDEYQLFRKKRLGLDDRWKRWDVFISAFNSSERVGSVFAKVSAKERFWLVLPEYGYAAAEFPSNGAVHVGVGDNEAELVSDFVEKLGPD